jgi:hypothetical protein
MLGYIRTINTSPKSSSALHSVPGVYMRFPGKDKTMQSKGVNSVVCQMYAGILKKCLGIM